MRTAQQLFDTVVNHLRQQNAACDSDTGMCLYRNDKGMKCAVGAVIPDEMYSPKMEQNDIVALVQHNLLPDPLLLEFADNLTLLRRLQLIHDGHSPANWEEEFRQVAQEFNLTMPSKETSNGQ